MFGENIKTFFLPSLLSPNTGHTVTTSLFFLLHCLAELIENMDKKATWDRFYTETSRGDASFKNFEWFFSFDAVRHLIMPPLETPPGPGALLRVLDVGCGTSDLGPCIYRRSPLPVQVTCADLSPVAVSLMLGVVRARAPRPGNPSSELVFAEMDCERLHERFARGSLDLVVDKGTTDALLRSKDGKGKAERVLQQCLMALKSSGSLLQFSDEDPDARLPWLETAVREQKAAASHVGVQEVGQLRGVSYYCYQVTSDPVLQE